MPTAFRFYAGADGAEASPELLPEERDAMQAMADRVGHRRALDHAERALELGSMPSFRAHLAKAGAQEDPDYNEAHTTSTRATARRAFAKLRERQDKRHGR